MSAIDPDALVKAMDVSGVTPKQLADELSISLTYVGDLRSGRRSLKRNPELRRRIAKALNVPIHWIEHQPVGAKP
jgi:transcriptional regulator with XRE-family HTH domain